MSVAWAGAVWLGLGACLGFGLVIGLCVAAFGLKRLTAAQVPVRVRLQILPGVSCARGMAIRTAPKMAARRRRTPRRWRHTGHGSSVPASSCTGRRNLQARRWRPQ